MRPLERRPAMVDLFCGIGGASAAMMARRWHVVRVDIARASVADVLADVAALPFRPFPVDLLWASPPCDEYSRLRLPWYRDASAPDRRLIDAARAAVDYLKPRFWIIENVEAAQMHLGPPRATFGSLWLWGQFPWIGKRDVHRKGQWGGGRAHYRACTPYPLSYRLALSVERFLERQPVLDGLSPSGVASHSAPEEGLTVPGQHPRLTTSG